MINPGRRGVKAVDRRTVGAACRAAGFDGDGCGLYVGSSCDIASIGDRHRGAYVRSAAHAYAVPDLHAGTHRDSRPGADANGHARTNGNLGSTPHSNASRYGPGGVDRSVWGSWQRQPVDRIFIGRGGKPLSARTAVRSEHRRCFRAAGPWQTHRNAQNLSGACAGHT